MDTLFTTAQRIAAPFLRISLGIILLWIGALKFVDPSPIVMLLQGSLPFLAFDGFVYLLGVLEVATALALFAGFGVRYVGLFMLALWAGDVVDLFDHRRDGSGGNGLPPPQHGRTVLAQRSRAFRGGGHDDRGRFRKSAGAGHVGLRVEMLRSAVVRDRTQEPGSRRVPPPFLRSNVRIEELLPR